MGAPRGQQESVFGVHCRYRGDVPGIEGLNETVVQLLDARILLALSWTGYQEERGNRTRSMTHGDLPSDSRMLAFVRQVGNPQADPEEP
jgi:hypothetical protein